MRKSRKPIPHPVDDDESSGWLKLVVMVGVCIASLVLALAIYAIDKVSQ